MGEKPAWGVWRGISQLSAATARSKSARPALRRIGGLPAESSRVSRAVGFQTKEDIRFTGKMPELILTASDAPKNDPDKLLEYFARRTVLVSNLGPTVNDVELREAAKRAGAVRAVRVFSHFWTGCSTGCAAVEFTHDTAAAAAIADPGSIFQELRGNRIGGIVPASLSILRRLYHVRPDGSFDPDRQHWSFGTWLSPETIQRLCAAAQNEEFRPFAASQIHFVPSAALAAVVAALDALGGSAGNAAAEDEQLCGAPSPSATQPVPEHALAVKSEKLDCLDVPHWCSLHPLEPPKLESVAGVTRQTAADALNGSPTTGLASSAASWCPNESPSLAAPPPKARRVAPAAPGRVLGQLSRWTQLAALQKQS